MPRVHGHDPHTSEAASSAPSGAGNELALRLAYRPPYDWHHMLGFLAARALPGVERVDARGYARTVGLSGGPAVISVCALPSQHALELKVSGAAPAALLRLGAAARRTFDLAADPALVRDALRCDPLLAPLLAARPGLRIPGAWDPFECAVRAVLGQQVSVAAGRTLAGRLVSRVGRPIEAGAGGLTHLFPTPAQLAAAHLDGLGVTGARIRALQIMARAVADGRLDFSRPASEVAAILATFPGFGEWTAQYIALRALSDPDALPSGDLVLRRIVSGSDSPLTARQLQARAEAWRPWRGYAVIHLWQLATRATS